MNRSLNAAFESETLATKLTPFLLAEFDFSGGVVNFWSGVGDLNWNGKTWTGTGYFGGVSAIQETTTTRANGAQFVLSGIPTEVISIALGQTYQGRAASLYVGALDDSGIIVADPFKIFSGRMDIMEIDEGGEDATIILRAENKLIDLERTRERRYTPEDHKVDFPGDAGFDMVSELQDKEVIWAAAAATAPTSDQGGGSVSGGSKLGDPINDFDEGE